MLEAENVMIFCLKKKFFLGSEMERILALVNLVIAIVGGISETGLVVYYIDKLNSANYHRQAEIWIIALLFIILPFFVTNGVYAKRKLKQI